MLVASELNLHCSPATAGHCSSPKRHFAKQGANMATSQCRTHADLSLGCANFQYPKMPSCFTSSHLPYPASLTPFAIRWLPSSIPVPASAMLLPTAFPALPVAPSMVSPRPRLAAPTTPPTRLVKPPTVLPMVEVTNLTPAVAPESCWPIGIAVFCCCCFFVFLHSKRPGQLFALSRIVRLWRSRERSLQSLFILF